MQTLLKAGCLSDRLIVQVSEPRYV
uniref:Uncharacterized protein n=1 Tax=Vitis vinifera TaxID=29760 RepID=F6GVI2_VITVI